MTLHRTLPAMVFNCCLLTQPFLLCSQETDWDRLMKSGDAAAEQKQYALAETSYRQAASYAESHWRKDARVSAALIKVAETYNAEGKKEEAESSANRAVASNDDALKEHKPKNASDEYLQAETSATLLTRAGDLFAAHEKYSDAETLYQRVITIRDSYAAKKAPAKPNNEDFLRFMVQTLGNSEAKLADAQDKLGMLYLHERKFDQAQQMFEHSQAVREKAFGPEKPQVSQSLSEIAMCYALQGKYDLAEPLYKRVITILERATPGNSEEMAIALENYALDLRKAGREAEAKPIFEKAREVRSQLSAPHKE